MKKKLKNRIESLLKYKKSLNTKIFNMGNICIAAVCHLMSRMENAFKRKRLDTASPARSQRKKRICIIGAGKHNKTSKSNVVYHSNSCHHLIKGLVVSVH
jgi:hypothetical protein